MVKVSITLPNNAQITFESEEPEVIHEVVGMVLRDLPRDLMRSGSAANGNSGPTADAPTGVAENIRGIAVEDGARVDARVDSARETSSSASGPSVSSPAAGAPALDSSPGLPVSDADDRPEPEYRVPEPSAGAAAPPVPPEADWDEPVSGVEEEGPAPGSERAFVDFCRSANPLGDMRRVVVAAEGASRFLGVSSVDEETLGGLFDLAGWARPHSFIQTLRNAARTKFRWLERIPGRAGHYRVTDIGRATALG